MSPEEIVATLERDEKVALLNFQPGIHDARWMWERYVRLEARGLLKMDSEDGRRFDWTDDGLAVAAELEKEVSSGR